MTENQVNEYNAEITRLHAENKRLRITLQTIANEENCPYRAEHPDNCLELAIQEAKQALEVK